MAVPALAFSGFFREKLVSGRMKGTILVGRWDIPESEIVVYCGDGSVEDSKSAEKLFAVKIKSCKPMKTSSLSDGEAKVSGCNSGGELRAAVKKWHGCADDDIVTFVEWE